jgi:glutamate racemase
VAWLAAMFGVFDSGLGGLTVLRALAARFPRQTAASFLACVELATLRILD